MQQQHRNHLKGQLQSRKSASAATLSQVFFLLLIFCYAVRLYLVELVLLLRKKQLCPINSDCWSKAVITKQNRPCDFKWR
jgi:hypothetical protein